MRVLSLLALLWAPVVFGTEAARVTTMDTGVQVIENSEHRYFTGFKPKAKELQGLGETHVTLNDCDNLPAEFDLRDLNVVAPVRDQGQCGSCWAFSQTQSLESATVANGGPSLDLSEQELVSCDTANEGCNGGNLNGFGYQIKNGQSLLKDYPYTSGAAGDSGTCQSGLKPATQGSSFVNVGDETKLATEKDVQCALFKSHTIPWIVVAASDAWMSPPTGDNDVYTGCAADGQLNHAVGVVGWKTIKGKVYFKMRNSWGTSWGGTAGRPGAAKGYMLMPLGCDQLGAEVAYLQTKAQGCQAPEPRLPAQISIQRGDTTRLAVTPQAGVTYAWEANGAAVGAGPDAAVSPAATTVYRVVGRNACGTGSSQVRVNVLP